MRITKLPELTIETIDINMNGSATRGIVSNIFNRIDRILGGDPQPSSGAIVHRIAGRRRWGDGTMVEEAGEKNSIELGKKFTSPFVDSNSGLKLHGIIPLCRNIDGTITFCVDHIE